MSSERIEWVEIIEPKTKEHLYANLTTGECVWHPPEGANIKRTDDSQWWELFDTNTQRFYYYNVASQTTVWHRPLNCDIIPLAKLQILKQNTDPSDRKDDSTQTSHGKLTSKLFRTDQRYHSSGHSRSHTSGCGQESRSTDLLASPHGRHSYNDASIGRGETHKYCRHTQGGSSSSRGSQKHIDSGKSSDSSLSSVHGYRRLHEGGSLRLNSSQQHKKQHNADNCYRMLQESSSSHNIPHVSLPDQPKLHPNFPQPILSYSLSNSSDLAATNSPTHAMPTPQLKKKLSIENSSSSLQQRNKDNCGIVSKHQSFDYSGNSSKQPSVSLTRSGSFMSPSSTNATRQNQPPTVQQRNSSAEGNGGSDDSMHEKYFKSVENTPVSRRRNTTTSKAIGQKTCSSDSSPQSPISPQNVTTKASRPSMLSGVISATKESASSYNSNLKNDPELLNLDITNKPERYLDKMSLEKGKISPCTTGSNNSGITMQQINHLMKPSSIKSLSSQTQNDYNLHNKSIPQPQEPYFGKTTIANERPNKDVQNTLEKGTGHKKHKKKQTNTNTTDVEYDNGNTSPLYSNWDQEMQQHLLPLQHYILEQAKLSGCYRLGDPLDSDSLHSDSQSEHSFSGHEPDNEDSDHSDGRGDYLTHHYGGTGNDDYDRAGASYYNFDLAFDKNEKEDISEEVETRLENEREVQIYSPVRNHPFFHGSPVHNNKVQIGLPIPKSLITQPDGLVLPPHHQVQQIPQLPSTSSTSVVTQLAIMKECDIEKFAQDNLNLHSKGIFRKKSTIRDMLRWTSNAISRPMLALSRDKAGKKMATELFKLVQIYMGDRKARAGMSLNSVALDVIQMAVAQAQLRDELYVQLCRQTTENPMRESLIRGWELMTICLSFIPPSPTFQPALLNYMNQHLDPTFATTFPEVGKWPIHVQISHYATIACRRLERIGSSGKKQAKKPTDDEINQARDQIFRDSMFGNTLTEVMELQKDRFPDRQLPWVQVTLSEQILILSGKQTEGIFRVSADVDEVNYLKTRLDRWEVPHALTSTIDAHTHASLLKLWYRELYDPLIPDELYEECVQTDDPAEAAAIINRLPRLNRMVLTYLVHFLQQFSQPDVVALTKMDSANLAMVFAPNCLRCTSQDPKVILENARKEMAFMRTLIINMDTTSVSYII